MQQPTDAAPVRAAYRALLRRRVSILLLLILLLLTAFLVDFSVGPLLLSPRALLRALLDAHGGGAAVIVWHIRLPYALMAILVGLSLGLAGSEMQTILDNPLASPFTLGLSAASAFGASLAIILNWKLPGIGSEWAVSADAFAFAICSSFLLDIVARVRGANASTVVLFGIALVFTFQALVSLLQFLASEDALQDLVFWTMGSVTRATWPKITVLAVALAVVAPFSFRAAWALTALRMGEDRAASFGIDVPRMRLASLLRISILAALAVSFTGTIGFIGLVAPHIARRLVGEDHRFYLPAGALVGGILLSVSSMVAKNAVPGVVVPVGIVTALVGIPFFIGIVLRRRPS